MNWYKHYIGDYQRDTGHLSMLEHGAYRLMLDTHYATEKPLPKTHSVLFRLLRALDSVEQDAVLSVLNQYWTETPEGYINERSLEEFYKTSNKIKAARENGNRGGRPKKTHDITETKTETITETKPATKAPQTPDTRHQTITISSNFDQWWAEYPKRVGKGQALKAYRSACKITNPETLLTHAKRYAAERAGEDKRYTKNPATWLNGQCWLDEPEEPHAAGRSNRNLDEAARRKVIAETLGLAGGAEGGDGDGELAHGNGVVLEHPASGEGTGEGGDPGPGSDDPPRDPQGPGGGHGQATRLRGGTGQAVGRQGGGNGVGRGARGLASRFADGSGDENDSDPQVQHTASTGGDSGACSRETGAEAPGAAHSPHSIGDAVAENGVGIASQVGVVSPAISYPQRAVAPIKPNFRRMA